MLELERHIPALRRYAWALTRHGDAADDLVQDCLERAMARDAGYGARGELRAWLFSILHNLFVSDRRRAARRPTASLEDAPEPAADGGQEASLAFRDLLRALDTLSPEHRAVLLLVGVEDLSYEATARILGVPLGTVMSRLSRARERLRLAMAGEAPGLRIVR